YVLRQRHEKETNAHVLSRRLMHNVRQWRAVLNNHPEQHEANKNGEPKEEQSEDYFENHIKWISLFPELPGLQILLFTDFVGEFHAASLPLRPCMRLERFIILFPLTSSS